MTGHVQEGMTIKKIKSLYGFDVAPGTSISIDIPKDKCQICCQLAELIIPQPRQQSSVKEGECKPKFSSAQRDADKVKTSILRRFRADQETRVTLHNVHYVYTFKDGSRAVCKASFHGKVMKAEASSENEVVSAKVLIALLPRKDVSFPFVSECHVEVQPNDPSAIARPTFLEMRKTQKQGRCFVALNYEHLSREVGLVFLGSRCNPDKCNIEEKSCRQHGLISVEKLQIISPPTKGV